MPEFSSGLHGYFIRRGLWWFALPVAFLSIYVVRFSAPKGAVLPHLVLVFSVLLFAGALRYGAYRWLGERIGQLLGAFLSALLLLVMLFYYSVTMVGLDTLGRVISWSLITTYLAQGPELLGALGVPTWLPYCGITGLFAAAVWSFWRLYKKSDGVAILAAWGGNLFALLVSVLLIAIPVIYCAHALDGESHVSAEPVSLMLYPYQGKKRVQSHYVAASSGDEKVLPVRAEAGMAVQDYPNVIVIVVDALRADHLAFNGYHRSTAPYLESLYASGKLITFPETYAVCSESSCGLMALAGSRYVHQFAGLSVTLHDVLRAHGYRINMILGGDHTNFYGLREAYGKVDTYYDGSMTGGRYYMNDDQLVVEKVAGMDDFDGRPHFFQFHLMSVHGLGSRDSERSPFQPVRNYYKDAALRLPGSIATHAQAYVNYYDNGIVRGDSIVERLLSDLGRKKYLDNALVLITGDHGEMLGEHGLVSHAKAPFEQSLKIPLLLARFGRASWRISDVGREPASQVDIAPTVLNALGIEMPEGWVGAPLQKERRTDFLYFQQGRYYGLIDLRNSQLRWKYWVEGIDSKDRAFELLSDPGEERDRLSEIAPDVKRAWKSRLIESHMTALEYIQSFQ
ncbi:sulfatase [Azonexus sp. IMCC34839]|uniref:sulfatase family protein n=1 Tax=Azonexus sp. IMCC34839 TaxID=3133695 RepID=UPI0039999A40